MDILDTILPVFLVIGLGSYCRHRRLIPEGFLAPANRLVYYLAIPAMIFSSIARSALSRHFSLPVLAGTLIPVVATYALAWLLARGTGVGRKHIGTFVQTAIHGNLGYIGFAVAFYFLGADGFAKASIVAGFLMILQNLLSVIVLQHHAPTNGARVSPRQTVGKILGNPIILSAVAGMGYALLQLPLPQVAVRTLDILSALALPLALLVIGASLSFRTGRHPLGAVILPCALKLLFLPGAGLLCFHLLGLSSRTFLPGLILLAAPSATVTYVMAKELGGDTDLAITNISVSTALSAVTFLFWLHLAS